MKRYLILGDLFEKIYGVDILTIEKLIKCKDGSIDSIIDTQNNTYFDPDKNEWIVIKTK